MIGWITVAAYLLTFTLCLSARKAASGDLPKADADFEPSFWGLLAASCLVLAFNKQLDLQTLLTSLGRDAAKEQGWYEQRRMVQQCFIWTVSAAALAIVVLVSARLRTASRWAWLAVMGFAALTTFVVTRAASFHHMDAFISGSVAGILVNHVLELGALLIVGAAAVGRRYM